MGADPFKKGNAMARSPGKMVECRGRQPSIPQQENKAAQKLLMKSRGCAETADLPGIECHEGYSRRN